MTFDDDLIKHRVKRYWSRVPGRFVDKHTGKPFDASFLQRIRGGSDPSGPVGPTFAGTVREWYETLVETIIDLFDTVHDRDDTVSIVVSIVVSRDVGTMLMASVLFSMSYPPSSEELEATGGLMKIGQLCAHDVLVDPGQPRSIVRVGHVDGLDWWLGEVEILDMGVA